MAVKFARLDYIRTHDEIPIKFNVVRQNLESNLSWYIDRYNPLAISECAVAGELGVKVLLPVTERESLADRERTRKIIFRAMNSLKLSDVEIIMPPVNIEIEQSNGVMVADGTRLFPFFMCQAIKKWARENRRDLRFCEAAVINGRIEHTESVLDHICEELNFLTVVDLNDDRDRLLDKADRIFDDTGLNVVVRGKNKAVLKTADIIINTSSVDFDTAYKRGAVVFDLSGDVERRRHLIDRRPDVMVVDGLLINYKNSGIPLALFEMAVYLKNRNFRNIILKGYDWETGAAVFRFIGRMGLDIFSFMQMGKIVRV